MKIILESVEEVNEFIENWNGTVYSPSIDHEVEEVVHEDEPVTYRNYPPSTRKQIPIFIDVDEHGILYAPTQKNNLYTIHVLLELQRKIPLTDKFKTWGDLTKAIGEDMSHHTVQRICAGIELGYYDHIFSKWNSFALKYDEFGQVI